MNAVLTIRVKTIVVTVCALVALAAAYLVGAAGRPVPAAHAAESGSGGTAQIRTIVMAGTGEVTAVPDQLAFRLSVHTRADDVTTALDRASAVMRRVQAALREEGIARRDVQTAGLDIRAVYDYPDDAPPVITGYAVQQEVGVLVRSLRASGDAIAAAVGAGGNAVRLHGLSLRIGDEETLMRAARDGAVAEATAKARQYAAATGQRLGDVLSVEEVSARPSRPIPVYETRGSLDAASVRKVPISAGSSTLKVTVRVEWSFA